MPASYPAAGNGSAGPGKPRPAVSRAAHGRSGNGPADREPYMIGVRVVGDRPSIAMFSLAEPSSSRTEIHVRSARLRDKWPAIAAALLAIAALAPTNAPAALDEGRPACDYCRMIFTDPRFGVEVNLKSGARKIYDAVECMAAAVLTDSVAVRDVKSVTLVDHARPGTRVPIERAVFLHCPEQESPMGQSLLAFATKAEADSTCPPRRGTRLDWRGVLTQVNSTWFQGKLAVEPHVKLASAKPGTKPKP